MISRFQQLCQEVFRTEQGQDLLEELEAEYCRSVFDENTNKMAYNAGQHDLVALLRQLTQEQIDP